VAEAIPNGGLFATLIRTLLAFQLLPGTQQASPPGEAGASPSCAGFIC